MASETVERERPSKDWIFYRDGEPYGIEAAHSHSVARFIAALLAQELPSEGEDNSLYMDLSEIRGEMVEPSTTEGEREKPVASSDILSEWGMYQLGRVGSLWVEPWGDLPGDALCMLAKIAAEVAQHRNDNAARILALLAQPQEPEKRKHGFRIVGDEDALLETCEGEPVEMESVGIYEDMPTPCPRCGDKLVLKMGHSVLYVLP